MSYSRGYVVILPFPFVLTTGVEQKGRLPDSMMEKVNSILKTSIGL